MTDLSKIYTSKHLKAADLGGCDHVVTIDGESVERIKNNQGQEDERVVLSFREFKQPLILNLTNATTIGSVLGDQETSRWVGRQITIGTAMVEAFGDTVPAIRVRPTAPPTSFQPPNNGAQTTLVLGAAGAIRLRERLAKISWQTVDLVAAVATRDPAASERIKGVAFENIPQDTFPVIKAALDAVPSPAASPSPAAVPTGEPISEADIPF